MDTILVLHLTDSGKRIIIITLLFPLSASMPYDSLHFLAYTHRLCSWQRMFSFTDPCKGKAVSGQINRNALPIHCAISFFPLCQGWVQAKNLTWPAGVTVVFTSPVTHTSLIHFKRQNLFKKCESEQPVFLVYSKCASNICQGMREMLGEPQYNLRCKVLGACVQ